MKFDELPDGPKDEHGRTPRRGVIAELGDGVELVAHEYTGPALVVRPDQPAPVPTVRVSVVGSDEPRLPTLEETSAALLELGGGFFSVQLQLVPGFPIEVQPGAVVSLRKLADVEARPRVLEA